MLMACSDPDPIIHESSENSESSIPLYECNDSTACYEEASVKVWFSSNDLKPEQEFYIYVKPTLADVKIVSAKIEGTVMEMGYIPLFFDSHESEVFTAKGMVGICDTDKMLWQLSILIEGVHGRQQALSISLPITYP